MTAREKYGFKLYHAYSLKLKGVDYLPMASLVTYTGSGAVNLDFMETHPHKGCCMDSGAFPAWKQNKDLDVGKYIQFAKAHQDSLDWFAQMDYIPRQSGGKTEDLQRFASDETWERYKAMHEAPEGLDISKLAFVVHGASNIEPDLVRALTWRSKKTGRGVEMLALGLAMPDKAVRLKQLSIAEKILKQFNFTGKFHALGIQDKDIYKRFTFITSADSSSSIRLAISGAIQIDGKEQKILDDEKLSHKSKLSPKMRELQKQFLKSRCEACGRDWSLASRQEGYIERLIWGCMERDKYFIPKEFQ